MTRAHILHRVSPIALALTICSLFPSPLRAGPADGRLDAYWIDVEGGAATLIVTPSGESVLIDSGNPGERDAGRIFKVATEVAGLKQIDHLVTTHYHRDHFGGAADLAKRLPIRNVYDNGKFEGGWERPDAAYLEFKTERRAVLNPGDDIPLKQGADAATKLRLRCVGTRKQFIDPPAGAKPNPHCDDVKPQRPDYTDNANSVVLLLEFGPFRLFDGGDLTWNVEKDLVCPVNRVGEVDVYDVNHHGLDVSNNPALVKALAPTVAVMPNGTTKGCGPATFATLKSTPSVEAIYQLHRNLRPDGKENNTADEHIANEEADCAGHYVKLSVDPMGKTYTVSVPSKRHERTFQTRSKGEGAAGKPAGE